MAELRVAARFCGPPGVANGGYASGSLAALLGGATKITLRRPLPLGRSLPVGRWTADECHGTSYATGASNPGGT